MKAIIAILALGIFFGTGMIVGSQFAEVPASGETARRVQDPQGKIEKLRGSEENIRDHLRLSQSSTNATSAIAESLADPKIRSALEKKIREVPFAVLKQIYLERQDEAWERQQERYPQPKGLSDQDLERRADRLFDSFSRARDAHSYFVSRGELTLRNGKSYPYIDFVEFYSSHFSDSTAGGVNSINVVQGEALAATKGSEMCYGSTLFVRIGEKYASDGHSNCLSWVPVRNQRPFALHSNYNSKRLVPLFDTVSIALPGFGADDVHSEWYDAGAGKWTSIGRVRFDPVSKEEFVALEKEIQLETDPN